MCMSFTIRVLNCKPPFDPPNVDIVKDKRLYDHVLLAVGVPPVGPKNQAATTMPPHPTNVL